MRRKKSNRCRFEGRAYRVGTKLLLKAVDVFDVYNVEYQIDYGTLLGLVRDGDLIPWDHDIDISIPSSQIENLCRNFWKFRSRGWFVHCVTMKSDCHAWRRGDIRVVKIRSCAIPYLIPGEVFLDISIRYPYGDFHWWSTCGYVCRAATRYFAGGETIEFANRSVRVPQNYEQYLTEVYGDWRTPNPQHRAADDGVIVRVDNPAGN
jgi:lipopolysaccharide cholinephosphotransferase